MRQSKDADICHLTRLLRFGRNDCFPVFQMLLTLLLRQSNNRPVKKQRKNSFRRSEPVSHAWSIGAILAFAMALCLVCDGPSAAQVYKWTDENGKTHFTDDPSSIPPVMRENSGEVELPAYDNDTPEAVEYVDGDTEKAVESEAAKPVSHIARMKGAGGGYTVEASLNGGVKANMLIDTGSSFTIVSPGVAANLGYTSLDGLPRLPVSTAGGVTWIYLIAFDSVEVGGAKAEDVEGGVSPALERGMDGLLGMSFLKEFKYRMDGGRGELALTSSRRNGKTYGGKDKGWWLTKYNHYVRNIRKFTEYRDRIASGAPAFTEDETRKISGFSEEDMARIVGYYRARFEKLERRAASLGVPRSWRIYP